MNRVRNDRANDAKVWIDDVNALYADLKAKRVKIARVRVRDFSLGIRDIP